MARGRMISKSLSSSQRYTRLYERAGRLAEFCQAIYPLLIAHSDDFGRLQGDPSTVKLQVFPGSSRKLPEFQGALEAMHDVELIYWYEVNGRKYVQINKFDEHQAGLHKRTKSRFPEPPGVSGKFREFPSEEKRTEQNRTEEEQKAVLESPGPDGRALWRAIVDRLKVSDHNRTEWFDPCVVARVTSDVIEIEAPKTVAAFVNANFRRRITDECADLLGARRLVVLVTGARRVG